MAKVYEEIKLLNEVNKLGSKFRKSGVYCIFRNELITHNLDEDYNPGAYRIRRVNQPDGLFAHFINPNYPYAFSGRKVSAILKSIPKSQMYYEKVTRTIRKIQNDETIMEISHRPMGDDTVANKFLRPFKNFIYKSNIELTVGETDVTKEFIKMTDKENVDVNINGVPINFAKNLIKVDLKSTDKVTVKIKNNSHLSFYALNINVIRGDFIIEHYYAMSYVTMAEQQDFREPFEEELNNDTFSLFKDAESMDKLVKKYDEYYPSKK